MSALEAIAEAAQQEAEAAFARLKARFPNADLREWQFLMDVVTRSGDNDEITRLVIAEEGGPPDSDEE